MVTRRSGSLRKGLAVVGAAFSCLGVVGALNLPSQAQPLPGTRVDGLVLASELPVARWLEQHASALEARELKLKLADLDWTETFGDLGLRLDIQATELRLRELTQYATLLRRVELWHRARRGELQIHAVFKLDELKAEEALQRAAEKVRRDPVDASIDVTAHTRNPEQPGRELDIAHTLRELRQAVARGAATIELQTREIPPQVRLSELSPIDVTQVLSSYETDFTKNAGPRTHNIHRAAAYLDGKIIQPRKLLSFNRTVGPRVKERGFIQAPVIVNDEFEKDFGGGVCQVASTLHAAAVYAGFEIVERRSHSRPIGYTPIGLDAVVLDDNKADLKIKNPYDKPILIHAYLPVKTRIRIEFLGISPPLEARHIPRVLERDDFVRRVVKKSDMPQGSFRKRQRGSQGYQVISSMILKFSNGRKLRREYASRYYPVPEVFWINPSFDIQRLPPLPVGAAGIEIVTRDDDE